MGWGTFFWYLFLAYFFYYGAIIVMDKLKGETKKLASDDSEAIDITGYDEDHVVKTVDEFSETPVAKILPISVAVPSTQSQEEQTNALAGIMQPVVTKGFSLKELGDAAKAGAIELTRGIAFN